MTSEQLADEIAHQRFIAPINVSGEYFCAVVLIVERALREAEAQTPILYAWRKVGLDLAIRALHAYRRRHCPGMEAA